MKRYEEIRRDLSRSEEIWWDMKRPEEIWRGMKRYDEIWRLDCNIAMARYHKVWQGMARYGEGKLRWLQVLSCLGMSNWPVQPRMTAGAWLVWSIPGSWHLQRRLRGTLLSLVLDWRNSSLPGVCCVSIILNLWTARASVAIVKVSGPQTRCDKGTGENGDSCAVGLRWTASRL